MSRRIRGVDGPHAAATLVTGGAPVAAAEVAVVLVHGRGGTAEGLVRLADEFYRSGATLLAPGAVRSTWFPAPHEAALSANEPALTSAVDCVAAAADISRDAGVPPERVVLAGVSQGGAVVAEFLRRRPDRYGGAFVVSAALPGDDLDSRALEATEGAEGGGTGDDGDDGGGPLAGTPVALDSSEDGPYVPAERVRATAHVFERAGAAVECRIGPGDGHGLSDATMDRIGERIAGLLDED
ncbi:MULTISPECIES: alpha/beta hydrolase [unclassified Halorubrum]|uniref:alpha/beta hydrolase n=1 Tax=unclassified Halorubrum TaxID=2642239 RepID=UPI0010F86C92|nr:MULTISPECIES: phospholipase [unclassified Halorubrum]TKX46245.1 phospholipase [Halorubrum sp. ARQ200]TKX50224.1 phospholipase [Halorubrum sp. ASP121]